MKVLLIKMSSLGDVIHVLPAITDLARQKPDIQIDWVIEEGFQEVGYWHQAIGRVLPVSIRRWRRQIWQSRQEIKSFINNLRLKNHDVVLDAQGLIKSATVGWLARGNCVGYDRLSAREPMAYCFYKQGFAVPTTWHAIDRMRALFAKVFHYTIDPHGMPDYGIELPKQGVTASWQTPKPQVVLLHGTSRADKCWPEDRWIDLMRVLTDVGWHVVLPWGNEAELRRAKDLAQTTKQSLVLPKMNLLEMAHLLQKAKGVVAVDTGLAHLASALSVPTVTLYGPTDPQLIGTRGLFQTQLSFDAPTGEVMASLVQLMRQKRPEVH